MRKPPSSTSVAIDAKHECRCRSCCYIRRSARCRYETNGTGRRRRNRVDETNTGRHGGTSQSTRGVAGGKAKVAEGGARMGGRGARRRAGEEMRARGRRRSAANPMEGKYEV